MSAQLPLYIDGNGDLCQFLAGDFLGVTQGGTGATSAAGARTALGVAIGTNVEAWSASLDALAALASTGLVVQTGANSFTDVAIAGTSGRIGVTNGSGVGGAPTIDLVAVTQGSTGTTFSKVQLDGYGRVINNTPVVAADINGLIGTTYVPMAGGTMTGSLILSGDPVTGLGAATKQYVDNNIQGLSPKPTATVATAAALPAYVYNNGASGVGATLTATTNGVLTVDTRAIAVGDLVLVKNETTPNDPYNGLYVCTTAGAVGAKYVLTRHVDMDAANEFEGAFIPVAFISGAANSNTLWLANPGTGAFTVGTTPVPLTQLNAATSYTQGNGISISGSLLSAAISGNLQFTGGNIDLKTLTIGGSGIGTFTKVTVDTYGRVTSTATATPADIGAQASSASLTALAALASTGLMVQTGANTFADVTLTGTSGRIAVTNGSGVGGNPTLDLVSGIITPGTYTSVTFDTYGRATAGTNPVITSAVTQTLLTNNQGSTVNIGQAVYTDSSGTFKLAQANSSSSRLCVGIIMDTTIASAASGNIAVAGIVTATTTQWNAVTGGGSGLTPGAKYYLSGTNAGGLTTTVPSTNYLIFMGIALSTTQLELADCVPVRLT